MRIANGRTDPAARPVDLSELTSSDRRLARTILDNLDTTCLSNEHTATAKITLMAAVQCCLAGLMHAAHTDGSVPEHTTARIEATATWWAERDLPIAVLHHAIHASVTVAVDLAGKQLFRYGAPAIHRSGMLMVDALRALTVAVSRGYSSEVRAASTQQRAADQSLTAALLADGTTLTQAHHDTLSAHYLVVAVALARHPQEDHLDVDGRIVARRKLRRVQAELATIAEPKVLSLLSTDGGTLLIPTTATIDIEGTDTSAGDWAGRLITRLGHSAGAPVTATAVAARRDEIPQATEIAHHLLDLAVLLQRGPGLHLFRDLACEYQITRPGPANQRLQSYLRPLEATPELHETLRTYLATEGSRQATARRLEISVNAVRHRLQRITELTGLDPQTTPDRWNLIAGMITRNADTRSASRTRHTD
ncbi:PucR family transcriptional regulator [Nocardia mexicana]|uniref:PucR-like helix-turn-helix protein n=1 Tax=Nocardia mexicana TaxID=279262 RepID=A0A370GPP0_9NOCA|nr:helix-turn-helix domain-containing protein [Nocardia mexicana]RDI44444.1 PucR-like helix-turn-helix protein [Nocardia mexicana]